MKAKDIELVKSFMNDLKVAENEYESIVALTKPKGGHFGLDSKAYIQLGGDVYGNGNTRKVNFKIVEIPELVRYCRKLESDAWGEVVGIRAKLRGLGVDLDKGYNQ